MHGIRVHSVDAAGDQKQNSKQRNHGCQYQRRRLVRSCGLHQPHALVARGQSQARRNHNAAAGEHELRNWDGADGDLRSLRRQAGGERRPEGGIATSGGSRAGKTVARATAESDRAGDPLAAPTA